MTIDEKILLGTGSSSAKIMFVKDNPNETEYEKGKYMSDRGGNLLRKSLKQLGIDVEKDCYFTAVVKYPTPEDRQPVRPEIQECEKYLDAEISLIKPKIIVPLGNVALKKFIGYVNVLKYRGKAVEDENGRLIFPMIDPNILFSQPKHTRDFVKDLQNLNYLRQKGREALERKGVEYRYLETVEEAIKEIKRLENSEWVVFDLETTGLNPFTKGAKIVCISMTDRSHYGVTIPLDHRETPFSKEEIEEIKVHLKRLLENEKIKKMAHNGKFDIKWLEVIYNIHVANLAFDPMLAHYISISEEMGGRGLKELAWEHTDMGGYDNELDEYNSKLPEQQRYNYDYIPWEILRTYAAADVDCTYRLYKKFTDILKQDKGWEYVFHNLLLPGTYTLKDIEVNGVKLDEKRLELYEKVYPERMKEIEEELRKFPEVLQIEREKHELFKLRQLEMKKPPKERDKKILAYNKYKNYRFNFGSPSQLRELLFDKLGLSTPFLTDTGRKAKDRGEELTAQHYSTGKETLDYLADKHPIAGLLSEWRAIDKLYGTYIKPARSWIGSDGLVHGTLNLTGTVTGRLAAERPNTQNFPRASEDPRSFAYKHGVKKMFVSRFGDEGIILQADFSQLELRIAAIFSKDEELIAAYREGKDIHRYVASSVYGVPEEEVTNAQRTASKAVGFGLLYGKGPHSLAEDMGVSLEEAEDFVNKYFEKFSGVKRWIDEVHRKVRKEKYVTTLTGRWRRLPSVDSNLRGTRNKAFRDAVNAPIQGSGADITLISLINLNKKMKELGLKSCICLTVHDSIVVDTHISELEIVYKLVKDIMENPEFDWVTVPIVVDIEIGRNYGELVELNSLDDLKGYDSVFDFIDEGVEAYHQKLLSQIKD